jgi:hypothetical protein
MEKVTVGVLTNEIKGHSKPKPPPQKKNTHMKNKKKTWKTKANAKR